MGEMLHEGFDPTGPEFWALIAALIFLAIAWKIGGFGQLTAYGGSMTIAQNWYSAPEPKAPRDAVAKNRGAGAATLAAHTRRNF